MRKKIVLILIMSVCLFAACTDNSVSELSATEFGMPETASSQLDECKTASPVQEDSELVSELSAIREFQWLGTDNKPFIAQKTIGGNTDVFYFDIDLDGTDEMILGHYYSHWLPGLTEVFKFDGREFVSVGGFYGRLRLWIWEAYELDNPLESIEYFQMPNGDIVFLQGFTVSAGGNSQSFTGMVNVENLFFQPIYSKVECYDGHSDKEFFYIWNTEYSYGVDDFFSYYTEEMADEYMLTSLNEVEYNSFIKEFEESLAIVDKRDIAFVMEYNLNNLFDSETWEMLGITKENYDTLEAIYRTNRWVGDTVLEYLNT